MSIELSLFRRYLMSVWGEDELSACMPQDSLQSFEEGRVGKRGDMPQQVGERREAVEDPSESPINLLGFGGVDSGHHPLFMLLRRIPFCAPCGIFS